MQTVTRQYDLRSKTQLKQQYKHKVKQNKTKTETESKNTLNPSKNKSKVNEYNEEYFSYIQDKDTSFYDNQFHCNIICFPIKIFLCHFSLILTNILCSYGPHLSLTFRFVNTRAVVFLESLTSKHNMSSVGKSECLYLR